MKQKVSDDEYTCETLSMCGCYNIEFNCNEITVLFFNFITDIARQKQLTD